MSNSRAQGERKEDEPVEGELQRAPDGERPPPDRSMRAAERVHQIERHAGGDRRQDARQVKRLRRQVGGKG
jgi:hypothetical protein